MLGFLRSGHMLHLPPPSLPMDRLVGYQLHVMQLTTVHTISQLCTTHSRLIYLSRFVMHVSHT